MSPATFAREKCEEETSKGDISKGEHGRRDYRVREV